MAWLEDLEASHDFVLYEADAGATPWTRRCLRAGRPGSHRGRARTMIPGPGPIEKEWLQAERRLHGRPQTLVLIHPDGTTLPSGTKAWLAARRLAGHQHLRWDRDADFARLARIVSRRSVGLVLGGGGARGMAHLGVLRALEERGIPVDMVGGTSIGAIVGGAVAMGLNADELELLCRETFQKHNPFSDVTRPGRLAAAQPQDRPGRPAGLWRSPDRRPLAELFLRLLQPRSVRREGAYGRPPLDGGAHQLVAARHHGARPPRRSRPRRRRRHEQPARATSCGGGPGSSSPWTWIRGRT